MRWLKIPKMAISLPLAVLAALTLLAFNESGYVRSTRANDNIAAAQQTRGAINKLLQNVLDAETGQRGYLLTGDPRYLEPYDMATADINQVLAELRRLYANDPEKLADFVVLAGHVSRKLGEMDVSVRLRKQGNEDAWKFVLTTDVGKEQMDAIRTQTGKLISLSTSDMEASQSEVTRSLQLSRLGITGIALAGLLAFYMYLRQTSALARAGSREQESLKRERDMLELQVRERTASLAELATHLQMAREDERGHLARELHDELGALLTAAKLDVARLKSRLGVESADIVQRLQHLTETLNSVISLKRRIIEDLRPSSLTHLGLVASLEILAREFSERSGIEIVTHLEATELDDSLQLTVYRLVQESLTNVGKYAGASRVEISLQNHDTHVSMEVRDDGKGFDATLNRPSTHGLTGMRHRVEAAGGKLTIASTPGHGASISAVLPRSH
ncbi:MAG: histidine kinase [Comamonadaceae bacterium]|nr:MAG: histidine kinase [Comamonadaceae bacterium]